jgi:NADH:ubiquinone oxidoreductase subunit 2 (subunit N)
VRIDEAVLDDRGLGNGVAPVLVRASALGLYYYAVVIAEMFFAAPARSEPVAGGIGYTFGAALTTAGTLILGIVPSAGFTLARLGTLVIEGPRLNCLR